jgi:hypothetical protein
MNKKSILFKLLLVILLSQIYICGFDITPKPMISYIFQSRCNEWTGVLSNTDKRNILMAHNKYRNQVAYGLTRLGSRLPLAKNMLQMYWNNDLAARAQQWANGCVYKHSSSTFRRMSWYTAGESIYLSWWSGRYQEMDWNRPINNWFNEINILNTNLIYSFNESGLTSGVGHLTQMIWAWTYQIGCGFAQYREGSFYRNFYVCHYGPGGNIFNYQVYKPSTTRGCSCPSGTSCSNPTFRGLCCPNGYCSNESIYYNGPLIRVPEYR